MTLSNRRHHHAPAAPTTTTAQYAPTTTASSGGGGVYGNLPYHTQDVLDGSLHRIHAARPEALVHLPVHVSAHEQPWSPEHDRPPHRL